MAFSSHTGKRLGIGVVAAMALFIAGFTFTPAPHFKGTPPHQGVQVAAAPGAQLSAITPLPDEQVTLSPSEAREINPSLPPVETYYNVMKKLEDSYYQKPSSEREMTYAAIRGMLASLGDPYTQFFDPDEYRRMQQDNEGEFGGIGATLEKTQGKTVVKEVLPATPAFKNGLKAGDVITEVDGKAVQGLTLIKIVDEIRGQVGTTVKITLERQGVAHPFVKAITREVIKMKTMKAEMILDPDKKPTGIAHIELAVFNAQAHLELDKALKQMSNQGMKALILDLRGNPGGFLQEAIEVASRFIDSGPVVILEQRGGERSNLNVNRSVKHYHLPLVVLVNKGSASASEIVAGAIKDTNTGILVGTDTYGKGLVQTINPIPNDGSAVKITTQRYLTPNGIDINKKGILPHYKVEITKDDITKKQDPQLDKAVSILKGELVHGITANAASPH
jgi:carboxyl-terminal processing protease